MRATVACTVAILIMATTAHADPARPQARAAKDPKATGGADQDDAEDDEPDAPAVPAVIQGTIVQRTGEIAYVDLGLEQGLRPGSVLHVLRTISLLHPVTKKTIVDHFPVGTLIVEQASQALSFGRLQKRIAETVKPGDVVRLLQAPKGRSTAAGEADGRVRPTAPAKPSPTKAAAEPPDVPNHATAGKDAAAPALSKPTASKDTAAPALTKPTASKDAAAPLSTPPAAALAEPESADLARTFARTLGRPLAERIVILFDYRAKLQAARPDSPYLTPLGEELDSLRRLVDEYARAQKAAQAPSVSELPRVQPVTESQDDKARNLRRLELLASIPAVLDAADPIELAVTMRDPSAVQAAFAYVRAPEATAYDRIKLTLDGDGYFRGRLPASLVRPPTIELFLEVVGYDGQIITAGTSLDPRVVRIEALSAPPASPLLRVSEIRGFFEYVDFYHFKGNDYYLAAQGDFTLRAGSVLAGVSGGFGVLYGRGGKNDVLQQLQDPSMCAAVDPALANSPCGRQVGFNYGYFEVEFHFGKWIGLAPRLLVGQTVSGPGAGGELKLRIGQATATNLQIGVSYFSNFGALGSLHLEWNNIKGWPMGAAVVVTNQPAEGDIGVRIYYQLAYRARSWLQPALRVGAASRNLEQIGLNAGLGLIIAW